MPALAALQKQNLLLDFASLKYACPDGLYLSLTPGDTALWAGVLFVRKGPYAPALLRLQISFPAHYPDAPPLITFSADIFHPLLTPLTTYTYTPSALDTDTVSAADEERLPPGGFSLRHGFPQWFGRPRRSLVGSPRTSAGDEVLALARPPTVYEVLDYVRAAFCDEQVLNSIPIGAAANPGAFHAWHAYRASNEDDAQSPERAAEASAAGGQRRPGQWNWEGVWEERVKKGVQASLSEPVLFGAAGGGDEIIRFADLDPLELEGIKERLAATVGVGSSTA